MAITKREYYAKKQIMDILAKEGHKTYAELLDYFDLNLTKDPNVIAYMIPDKAVIVINENLDIAQASTIVRHEILHEYLSHAARMAKHLGQDAYDKRSSSLHQLINIAADYEISNRGYTEHDKNICRQLNALVTEDDHEDWAELSFEEMFDKLNQEYQKNASQMQSALERQEKLNNQGDSQIQQAEAIEREANDISDELEKEANNSNSSSKEKEENREDSQKAKSIADKAKDAKDDAQENKENSENTGGAKSDKVFDTPEEKQKEQEKADKIAKKVEAAKKALERLKDKLEAEDTANLEKEKARKADQELKDLRADPISNFKLALHDLIRRQTDYARDNTWSRPNRRYAGTGIIAQGKAIQEHKIPLVNVYFDVSGSVQPYVSTTRAALGVIKNFVDRRLIKVKVYYVSNILSDNENDSTGGGADGDLIMNNIKATHPTNVIVVTDSDADYDAPYDNITLDGGVFFLIPNHDSVPNELMTALKGKRVNKTIYLNK